MVDTLKALKEDMLAFIDPGVAEDDIEHTVSVEHHNFLRWFDALRRLSAQQREPEPPTSEATADVSVDELAQCLRDADRQTGNCTDDDTAAGYMDLARALLASYRIERLDRLASGRR